MIVSASPFKQHKNLTDMDQNIKNRPQFLFQHVLKVDEIFKTWYISVSPYLEKWEAGSL